MRLLGLFLISCVLLAQNSILRVGSSNNYCEDSGSSDTYACSLSPAISSLTTGGEYKFKANTANTGAASLNLNSIGAVTIMKVTTGGVATNLATNDIAAGMIVKVIYDGTNFQMQSPLGQYVAYGNSSGEAVKGVAGAYDSDGWNSSVEAPTKDAVRDKIETLSAGASSTAGSYYIISANGTFHGYQAGNTMASANAVYTLRFYLPFPMDVANFPIEITTASAGNYFYWGVYSSDGNTRYINCSATTDATGVKACVQSPAVSLTSGWYQYAFGASNTAAGCTVQNISANNTHLNTGTVQLGVGANVINSGSLPITLGSISSAAEEPCNAKLQQ